MKTRFERISRIVKRKPVFRKIEDADWPIIAVAYERGAFPFRPGLSVMDLRQTFEGYENQGYLLSVIDDENRNFRAGRGLVGLIKTRFDGWSVEPELFKFPWATKFNVARGVTTFLLEMKRSKEIGVCRVACGASSVKFLERMNELKLVFRCGFVPNGYPDGAMWLFNVAGKKQKG